MSRARRVEPVARLEVMLCVKMTPEMGAGGLARKLAMVVRMSRSLREVSLRPGVSRRVMRVPARENWYWLQVVVSGLKEVRFGSGYGEVDDLHDSRPCPMIPAFGSSPAAAAMKVDFPEPDGPRRRRQKCLFSSLGMLATKL